MANTKKNKKISNMGSLLFENHVVANDLSEWVCFFDMNFYVGALAFSSNGVPL